MDLGTILDPFWKEFGLLFGEILNLKAVPFSTSFLEWFSLPKGLKIGRKGAKIGEKGIPQTDPQKDHKKTIIFFESGYRWILKNNKKT